MNNAEIRIIEESLNERREKFKKSKRYIDEVYYNGQKRLTIDLGLRLTETEDHKVKLEKKREITKEEETKTAEKILNERRDKFIMTKKYDDSVFYNAQKELMILLGFTPEITENNKIKLVSKEQTQVSI